MQKLDAIIMAAGRGKRIHQASLGVPKVLLPIAGKPMLMRLLNAIDRAALGGRTIVVVGPTVEAQVRTAIAGENVVLAIQKEPRGTGDAVRAALSSVVDADHVLVINGDQPLYSAQTIKAIADNHQKSGATVTLLTVKLPDFRGWRSAFADWSRVVRNGADRFVRTVEARDAAAKELKITEVNPQLYCFKVPWLRTHIEKLTTHNAQKEYYITDLLGMAVEEGEKIVTVPVADPRETLGVNTPEQLAVVEEQFAHIKELWKS